MGVTGMLGHTLTRDFASHENLKVHATARNRESLSRWFAPELLQRIPNLDLCGLFHVSSAPISKFDLLRPVAESYGKDIGIDPYDDFHCDRSLGNATGYSPPSWPEMITRRGWTRQHL